MDWTKILNKFRSKKKQKAETAIAESDKILSEQMLINYLTKMAADLNYRLLCETEPFFPFRQVLYVEGITVTAFEYHFGSKKKKRKHKIFPFKKYHMPYRRQKER